VAGGKSGSKPFSTITWRAIAWRSVWEGAEWEGAEVFMCFGKDLQE
jgi:hypothetical protein